jgi:hypothetical protein
MRRILLAPMHFFSQLLQSGDGWAASELGAISRRVWMSELHLIMDARINPGHDSEFAARPASSQHVIAGLDPAIHDASRKWQTIGFTF